MLPMETIQVKYLNVNGETSKPRAQGVADVENGIILLANPNHNPNLEPEVFTCTLILLYTYMNRMELFEHVDSNGGLSHAP